MLLFASILEHVSFPYGRFKAFLQVFAGGRLQKLASDPDPTSLRNKDAQQTYLLRIQVRFKQSVEDEADLAWRSNRPPTPRRQLLTESRGPMHREGG